MAVSVRSTLTVALVLASVAARADQLDDLVKSTMAQRKIPGIVLAVVKDDKIVRQGAYGLANVELNVPATVETEFEIGSVSKQFTATGIMMLLEEGKLSLTDPISKYVQDLPEPWQSVTLRHLLSHTSGIPDIEEIFGYDSYRLQFTLPEIIKVANSKPMDFKPGDGWHYSNTGYYLLSIVIEKITGKPYGQVLADRIFKPLGMDHTRESDPTAVIPNRSAGYQVKDGVLQNRDPMQPSAILGAGALVSTVGDLAKWDASLYTDKLLKRSTWEQMWAPAKLTSGKDAPYGFGWFPESYRGHKSIWHSGGTAGFSCVVRRFPEEHVSVFVLSNLYATGFGALSVMAADTVIPGLSWASAKPKPDPDKKVREMLLKAMADVAKGGESSPYVSPGQWKGYSQASRDAWKDRLANMKAFEFLFHDKYAAQDTPFGEQVVESYVYRLTTDKGPLYVTFMLTPEGKVGLQIREEY